MTTNKVTKNINISRLNLYVGQSWNNAKIDNKPINTIFKDIDNGDGIIQDNELVILNQSYDKKRKITPEEAFSKINYADYTKDELIKRYPPNKYTVEESKQENNSVITITDKKTNQKVLEVTTKHGEYKTTIIEENNSNGELIMRRCYDSEGKLSCYDDSKNIKHNPIADLLNKDICAKDSFGLPTTDKDIEKHAKLITPENIIEVLENYEQRFGETFENAMNGESWLKKDVQGKEVRNRIIKHLTECLEKAYGYNKNYKNENSVISNEHHKGDTFSIVQNGDIITLTNKKDNKSKKINLEKLTSELPLQKKVKLKVILQHLPGEILEDIANEGIDEIKTYDLSFAVKNSQNQQEELKKMEESYLTRCNNIVFDNTSDFKSLIEKIGLTLNYTGGSYKENSTVRKNQKFMTAFIKELENYKNDGNKQPLDAEDIYKKCYAYLVTGESEYKEIIEKYFTETLEQSDNHIAQIRNMQSYDRKASKA